MAQEPNLLGALSDELAARFAAARGSVAALRLSERAHLGAILWRRDVLVTSEQSLPDRDVLEAVLADGSSSSGKVAGRDPATNVAVVRLDKSAPAPALTASIPQVGALVIAAGSDGGGRPSARLGTVNAVGPEWHSMRGGRIDARIQLDIRLAASEEGGPAFDAAGGWLGMTTFGPRGQILVIPGATVERIAPALLATGRVPRGWLGVALRPVAVPDELREAAGETTGLMVMSLNPEGPSAKAGIVPGDIILSVDGTSARRLRSVLAHLGSDSVGKSVSLRLIRGGAVIPVEAAITERPET
ncbi:MAG TPA: S1C family serine protease [Steroidobacteraceae bacterium]|jgi:S1-C subfamily serine protease|nr:S1C family serine protease [Steroidobacteraceae bacterium]